MYYDCMRLSEFNDVILSYGKKGLPIVADKYLIQGTPFLFSGKDEHYYEFKRRIAEHFEVGTHEIYVVGSAKQGFSYFKQRDSFNFESDVDVAITSTKLFETYEQTISEYEYAKKSQLISLNKTEEKQYRFFLRNLSIGWIRPDIFPDVFIRNLPEPQWDEFFKSLSSGRSEAGDYEVKGGVFKSYEHLKRYHLHGLSNKLMMLESKEII